MHRPRPALRAVVTCLLLVACGREPAFEDRTARVTLDGRTTTFAVDACVLDGQTAYVLGRSEGGDTVQAVVGVEADGTTGVPASTGLTATGTADGLDVAAFGPEAWARRGEDGPPPGSIASSRIRGARIQATGRAALVGPDDRPTQDGTVPITFDARCDDTDG